jgi:hypothetical protein
MSNVYLKCGSWESNITTPLSREGSCSKFLTKYSGPVLLIMSVVLAILTLLVGYGYIPVGSFEPMFIAGIGTTVAMLSFHQGFLQTLLSQGCIVVRQEQPIV